MAVAAGAAVLVAIVTGRRSRCGRQGVAVVEERHAREVKEFLASMFRDADPYQGSGKSLAVTDLLRQARARVDTLKARPELRVELLTLIGTSLLNLEDLDAAEQAARQALEEALATLGPDHEQTLHARVLMLGVHRFRGRTADMRRELEAVERALANRGAVSVAERVVLLESRGHLSIDDGDAKGGCNRRRASLRSRAGELRRARLAHGFGGHPARRGSRVFRRAAREGARKPPNAPSVSRPRYMARSRSIRA